MVTQILGCIGIGLVWGWLSEPIVANSARWLRSWIAWIAATFAIIVEIRYLGVSHAMAIVTISSISGLALRYLCTRMLSALSRRHTSFNNRSGI